jgi:hypothetical protein
LLRPLFSAAKKATITHYSSNSAYELGSRQNGSSAFAYSKSASKSLQASSSEENILPIQKDGVPLGTKERVQHFGVGVREVEVDVEQGVIKKEVRYQVKYERDPNAPGE